MRTLRLAWPWMLVSPLAVWVISRGFGLERGALPIQLTSFTPYVLLASFLVLALTLATKRWRAAGVAALVVATLIALVVPRAVGAASSVEGAALRVASVNLRIGGADPLAIVALARDADVDVLALQEVTEEAAAALEAVGIRAVLPYGEVHADTLASGSAVYSRIELTAGGVRPEVPGRFVQAYVEVRGVVIESAHPVPPLNGALIDRWTQGLRSQPPATEGRVLAGDFNATLDHAELRRLIDTGYRDAADEVGAGLIPTWPYAGQRSLVTPKITIDHILVPPGIGVDDFEAVTIPGTDHRAIIATLLVP